MKIPKFGLVSLTLFLCVFYNGLYGESEVSKEAAAEEDLKTKIEERLKALKRIILQKQSMSRVLNEELSQENEKLSQENKELKEYLEDVRQVNNRLDEENPQLRQALKEAQEKNLRLTEQINSWESEIRALSEEEDDYQPDSR